MDRFTTEVLRERLPAWSGRGDYVVAFSGGRDSTVLLHAMAALRERLSAGLRAVHVAHGLQADAGHWAAHCRQLCQRWSIPCAVRELALRPESGASLEALAREARYAALRDCLRADDILLTAHHQDDQAETLLLALLRGSGPHGLAAMPRLAPFPPGTLARPLLDVPGDWIADYARREGLCWIEDPSNGETRFERNAIRHQVLPLLRQRWPGAARQLARSAAQCAEGAALIDTLAREVLAEVRGAGVMTLSVSKLAALEPPLARAVLRGWIRDSGRRVPSAARLEQVLGSLLPARADAQPRLVWADGELRRYRDTLYLLSRLPERPAAMMLEWRGAELNLPPPLGRLRWCDANGEARDPGVSHTLRVGLAGASPEPANGPSLGCRPAPGSARRSLKKIFQQQGIPPWLRDFVPRVFAAERLIALAGVRACTDSAPAPSDSTPLRLCWEGHPWVSWGLFQRALDCQP